MLHYAKAETFLIDNKNKKKNIICDLRQQNSQKTFF